MGDPAAGIIHGKDMQKHGRPLRLGVDVSEALLVRTVGEAEDSV